MTLVGVTAFASGCVTGGKHVAQLKTLKRKWAQTTTVDIDPRVMQNDCVINYLLDNAGQAPNTATLNIINTFTDIKLGSRDSN